MSDDVYFLDTLNGFIIQFLRLYKTADSGNNWLLQLNSQYVIRTFGWLSLSHGFIIGDGIYETNDSGNTWQEILELRNVGLRKLHSPINYLGISVGNLGLVYKYIDTTIVPVELNYLTAEVNGNEVILKWLTSTELNNRGFEILRSKDSKIEKFQSWQSIGFISGNGTTAEPQSYFFIDENLEYGKYQYRLKQIDFDGTFDYSNIIEVEVGTPLGFYLSQNYPNPFNPVTTIKYDLPKDGLIQLEIFDVLGRKVVTLINETKTAGRYEVIFNASALSSGVYIYKLQAGAFISSKKMLLLK